VRKVSGSDEEASHPEEWRAALVETLKRAAVALKRARVPFALGGGYAAYARGGPASENDVDFLLREEDAETALAALEQAGLRPERPTEDWLLKAYDGDRLVDLIWRMAGRPVDDDLLARAEELDVCSVHMPVAGATDLVIGKLLAMTGHYCDFTAPLAVARSLREQVDWALVRRATADSPYAEAFLLLGERLAVLPPAGEESTWISPKSPTEDATSSKRSPKIPESASLASA
jgi:hypothetical protein